MRLHEKVKSYFPVDPTVSTVCTESHFLASTSSCRKHFTMWQQAGLLCCLVWVGRCVVWISCSANDPVGIIQSSFIAVPVGNKTGRSWNKLLAPKEQHKQNKIELLHYKDLADAEVATGIRLLWGEKQLLDYYYLICIGLKIFPLTAEVICCFWKYLEESYEETVYEGVVFFF